MHVATNDPANYRINEAIDNNSKPRTALFQGGEDDEPMVHQNINLSAFTVCVEHNIMKEGIFNLDGLSSSLIFKGAEFFRKEEKEKAREYVNIGSMHVEIPRVFQLNYGTIFISL